MGGGAGNVNQTNSVFNGENFVSRLERGIVGEAVHSACKCQPKANRGTGGHTLQMKDLILLCVCEIKAVIFGELGGKKGPTDEIGNGAHHDKSRRLNGWLKQNRLTKDAGRHWKKETWKTLASLEHLSKNKKHA